MRIDLQRITLYYNKHKRLSYDSDSDHDKLDGSDSSDSFWYSDSYRGLPFFIFRPKLKIEQADIRELRDCLIYVHNVGKRTASNIRIKFHVTKLKRTNQAHEAVMFRTLKLETFDLDPDQARRIKICEITEEDKRAIFAQNDRDFIMPSFSVERGHKYELLIRFAWKDFSDRKVWHLSLDLSRDQPKFGLVARNIFS